jgi:ATP-dependent DNA ligase
MSLPISKKFPPMEAQPASELPAGPQWHYEPKWDGFRCRAFRDVSKVELESKSQKPLTRYFPELVAELSSLAPKKFVLDGEIVIPVEGKLSFDNLLMRIHPAESRIRKLSQETPCVFIVFDLLVDKHGKSLIAQPLRERRRKLESFAKRYFKKMGPIRLSPMTCDLSLARKWFHMGVGLDGIIAKREDLSYQSGKRTGMEKIKKQRTADCVVGGFRYLEKKKLVGSLLLGLYNDQGLLDHVGFTSSIRNEDRQQLTKKLETMVKPPGFTGKAPGGLSRWSTKHSMEWKPVQPNSWPKFSSITSPADDFATERSSCAGGLKKIRAVAP